MRAVLTLALVACAARPREFAPAEQAAIARAALTTLFLEREHAGELVLWRGTLSEAPAFSDLALGDSVTIADFEPAALAMAVPVGRIDLAGLEAHFRAHADAWGAWYERHPTSGGVVALTIPRRARDDAARASLLVGRLCGDHCRMAWRVVVRRVDGAWRTESVTGLRVPKS